MDAIDTYLKSNEFLKLADGLLYQTAISEVGKYFEERAKIQKKPVNKNQVKGLQLVSTEQSLSKLKLMAKNQLDKARKRLKDSKTETSTDTLFWDRVKNALDNQNKEYFSLLTLTEEILASRGLLPDTKKERKSALEKLASALASVFFEHFCCHYYLANQLTISNLNRSSR